MSAAAAQSQSSVSTSRQEDQWSWVKIGDPFPEGPMRVKGEQNQYVALWYKHGKPICGRAWNNGGVVECSFAYQKAELKGKEQLGGQIQILTYDSFSEPHDAWKKCGYWYEWVRWGERRAKPHTQLVFCGDAAPVLMTGNDGNVYCGNMQIGNETLSISHDGKTETKSTHLKDCLTVVRNFTDPAPPREPEAPPPAPVDYDDRWIDVREGDSWSKVKFHIPALEGVGLKGQSPPMDKPSVVLWYKDGQPVMGAMWQEDGKIKCKFGWHGKEYQRHIGSIQVLVYNPNVAAFKISWQTYATATKHGSGWRPVIVKHSGVDCAPCVVPGKDGKEYLGKVIVSEEKASYAEGGQEHVFVGPQVQKFMVLCRTD